MRFTFINYTGKLRNLSCSSLLLFITAATQAQEKVIPLYNGTAPGSETWNWQEAETSNTPIKMKVAYNVTKPTLTLYSPDSANGTAVILCPGGFLRVLNIEHEGANVAKILTKKGITVFLLKYRLVQSMTNDPWKEMFDRRKDSTQFRQDNARVRDLVLNDVNTALTYVRKNANEYKIDPQKVGLIGFSGGGGLAIHMATSEDVQSRPDFAAFIYSVYNPTEKDKVPSNAPPAFIACATDDTLASPLNSTRLYNAWVNAKRPAELHIFAKGGHGLRANDASRNWFARFEEWLATLGFISNKKL